MTPADRSRLTGFISARRWASLAFLCALALGMGLGALAMLRPDWVFRSPLVVFALPLGVAMAVLWRAPLDWWRARRDLAADAVLEQQGEASVHWRARPGLFSGLRAVLTVDALRFDLDEAEAGEITPGRVICVRYGAQSRALLSIDPVAMDNTTLSPAVLAELTEREGALLSLMAQGLSDKEIARRLNLSPATVRTYNSTLYAKLGVQGRGEAVHLARGGLSTSVD